MNTAQTLTLAREYEADLLALLRDLVRLPSVNGRDTEAAVAQRLAEEARRLGLTAELRERSPFQPAASARSFTTTQLPEWKRRAFRRKTETRRYDWACRATSRLQTGGS